MMKENIPVLFIDLVGKFKLFMLISLFSQLRNEIDVHCLYKLISSLQDSKNLIVALSMSFPMEKKKLEAQGSHKTLLNP